MILLSNVEVKSDVYKSYLKPTLKNMLSNVNVGK